MATQLFQMLYNLIDMFFLGRVSSDAVAASGTAGMYIWLAAAFLMVGRMGAEIGVSQSIGQLNNQAAKAYAQNSIFLATILGILYGGVMIIFSHQLIGFLQIQETTVIGYAVDYLMIVALGIPLTFVSAAINGAFTGAGNSKLPFYINGIGITINVIISPVFIITLGLGIRGAAIATLLAQALVFVLFGLAIKYHKSRPFQQFNFKECLIPSKKVFLQILKWSLPISLESLCFTFLSMIIARFVAVYGADAIAAQRIGSQIESLSWLIGGGFASALTAFVGQNFGANKWDRIHKGFYLSLVIISVWGIFVSFILFFGAKQLMSFFISEVEIISLGNHYLRIFSVSQLATCIEALAAGAFRGVGKTQPPSIISITFNVLRVPLASLLSQTSLGLNGIWWGLTIGGLFKGVILMGWYVIYSRNNANDHFTTY